jgi:hypothetical protein
MRIPLLAFACIIGTFGFGRPVAAQNYPWCAYYGGKAGGENCGFSTLAQCQADIAGIGGDCERNTQYHGPLRRRYRRYDHRHHYWRRSRPS